MLLSFAHQIAKLWLSREVQPESKKIPGHDWVGYVADFRRHIFGLITELNNRDGPSIDHRFNRDLDVVELIDGQNQVIAQVVVVGEFSIPERAVVYTREALPPELCEIYRRHLNIRTEFREPLRVADI